MTHFYLSGGERWVVHPEYPHYAVSTFGRILNRQTKYLMNPEHPRFGVYMDGKRVTDTTPRRFVARAFFRETVPGKPVKSFRKGSTEVYYLFQYDTVHNGINRFKSDDELEFISGSLQLFANRPNKGIIR